MIEQLVGRGLSAPVTGVLIDLPVAWLEIALQDIFSLVPQLEIAGRKALDMRFSKALESKAKNTQDRLPFY